ncbi:MAG: hypothetical protein SPL50_07600 [Alloprevotella sp.]|nr:hypothetical protein [Alloprevotella sp.]
MITYKAEYSEDEVRELLDWAEQHLDELPVSLELGKEIRIPDVRRTVASLHDMAKSHGTDRSFSGQVYTLMRIREAVTGKRG